MEAEATTACKGDRTRAAIVNAAACMAARVGLNGLSIGNLAKRLEISKSGLFAHFRSKEELQTEALVSAASRFAEGVVGPALSEPRGAPRVRRLVEGWMAWVDTSCPGGCLFVQAAVELDDRPGPLRNTLVDLQGQWLSTIARMAQGGVHEGHFRADLDPQQFAFELQALMLGYHHSRRLMRDPLSEQRVHEAAERLIDRAQVAIAVRVAS